MAFSENAVTHVGKQANFSHVAHLCNLGFEKKEIETQLSSYKLVSSRKKSMYLFIFIFSEVELIFWPILDLRATPFLEKTILKEISSFRNKLHI